MTKIVDKIKNLLKHTVENGATESEAKTAFVLARKLMLKYKIEESEMIDSTNKDIVRICLSDYNINIDWVYLLITTFTDNFGVMKCIIKNGGKRHFILIGRKTDVECVKELIDCAYSFAIDKANEYTSAYKSIYKSSKGIKNSWLNGFAIGIYDKYEEQNKTDKKYELMTTVDDDVKRKFNEFTEDSKIEEASIKPITYDTTASMMGYKEGKKFGTTPLSH